MALSATVTPQVQRALETFLHNPVVERGTVNIFLAAENVVLEEQMGQDNQYPLTLVTLIPLQTGSKRSYLTNAL